MSVKVAINGGGGARHLDAEGGLVLPGIVDLHGEYKMAAIFGVNRATVRNALTHLQREGFLHARKGVGIFVRPLRSATSFRTICALAAHWNRAVW